MRCSADPGGVDGGRKSHGVEGAGVSGAWTPLDSRVRRWPPKAFSWFGAQSLRIAVRSHTEVLLTASEAADLCLLDLDPVLNIAIGCRRRKSNSISSSSNELMAMLEPQPL